MLIQYAPGKYDDKIPFSVQKKIIACECTGSHNEILVLKIAGGREHEFNVDECAALMSRQDKVKSWLKLTGLFLLLVAFSAGINNIISRICTGGHNSGIIIVVQLIMSLALVGYLISYLKISIERYIYGGLKVDLGEIYFQSEKERLLFGDVTRLKGE